MEKKERIKIGSVVRLKSGSPPMVVYMKHKPKPPKPPEGEKPEPPGPMLYAVAYFDAERNQIANLFPGLPENAFEVINLDLATVIDRVANGSLHPSYLGMAQDKRGSDHDLVLRGDGAGDYDNHGDGYQYDEGYKAGYRDATKSMGGDS